MIVVHDEDLNSSIESLSDDDNITLTSNKSPPPIAHARSYSDGIYSFDKSSVSSEGSEISVDRQKILRSRNYVSAESGVGEDIGSTEALSKTDDALSGLVTSSEAESSIAASQLHEPTVASCGSEEPCNQHLDNNSGLCKKSSSNIQIVVTPPSANNLVPMKKTNIFYNPSFSCKKDIDLVKSGKPEGSLKPQHPRLADKDFESDCSDCSVEAVRIITKM